jgi:hypothetical protein
MIADMATTQLGNVGLLLLLSITPQNEPNQKCTNAVYSYNHCIYFVLFFTNHYYYGSLQELNLVHFTQTLKLYANLPEVMKNVVSRWSNNQNYLFAVEVQKEQISNHNVVT